MGVSVVHTRFAPVPRERLVEGELRRLPPPAFRPLDYLNNTIRPRCTSESLRTS
jgi:hypothetical protein